MPHKTEYKHYLLLTDTTIGCLVQMADRSELESSNHDLAIGYIDEASMLEDYLYLYLYHANCDGIFLDCADNLRQVLLAQDF